MTDLDAQTTLPLPKVFEVYLQLANYPILADRVRRKIREEIFERGVIRPSCSSRKSRTRRSNRSNTRGLLNPILRRHGTSGSAASS